MRIRHAAALAVALPILPACDQIDEFLADDPVEEEQVALYQSAPVERRNITVAVEAAGIIEPVTTVEVKSKASGEILELPVDTGDYVQAGTLLARIDRRVLNNSLQQAKASLEVPRPARPTPGRNSIESSGSTSRSPCPRWTTSNRCSNTPPPGRRWCAGKSRSRTRRSSLRMRT